MFHGLNSNMCLVAMIFNSKDTEHFSLHLKFCWTVLNGRFKQGNDTSDLHFKKHLKETKISIRRQEINVLIGFGHSTKPLLLQ